MLIFFFCHYIRGWVYDGFGRTVVERGVVARVMMITCYKWLSCSLVTNRCSLTDKQVCNRTGAERWCNPALAPGRKSGRGRAMV